MAITVFSPLKWWGPLWLKLAFLLTPLFRKVTGTLAALSFIHFARWSIVKRIPQNGPPQEPERLNYRYLFFESNFNGSWEQYIDAFSNILGPAMKAYWGSSYGFPGPVPVGPFKRYILRNEFAANHYHSAYPEASTTMIDASFELRAEFADFHRRARGLPPDRFEAEYREFLTKMQRYL